MKMNQPIILWDRRGWAVAKRDTGRLVLCGGSPVVYSDPEEAESARLHANETITEVRHVVERVQ